MFGLIGNLAKAAVAVALTPVALAVDIVTIPASAERGEDHPFQRTGNLLNSVGDSVKKSLE